MTGFGDAVSRSPKRDDNTYTHYEVSWGYDFEAALPLMGYPHTWTL
jgi:hypothetical protein